MSAWSCSAFRDALEHALRGAPEASAASTAGLAWHEHLLGCGDCQELLASEEALEELLATLPEPQLPDDLTRRVLQRLVRERVAPDRLDELLDASPSPAAPSGLRGRVLAGLRAERRLDALLAAVPAPPVPKGLAARVLAGLEPERGATSSRPPHLLRANRRWLGLAAAAGLLLVLTWAYRSRQLGAPEPVDDAVLANLEVLENWDVLMSNDLDLYLASLDPIERTLLELETEEQDEEEGG